MTDWGEIWKKEKYPMWVKNGTPADYWNKGAKQRFERLAKNKDSSEKQVVEFSLKRTDTVLDIGCGTGRLTIPIAKRVKFVYAVDISKEMLKIAQREAEQEGLKNIKFLNTNFETLDRNKIEKIDVSISHNSLGVYDIRSVIKKIDNITKRDVFISIFAGTGEWLGESLATIIYGKQIGNIPSSADIIYGLLKEMGIEPDFRIRHREWKNSYDSIENAANSIIEFYKIKNTLNDNIKRFIRENSVWNGKEYTLLRHRDIADIHWQPKNRI